MSMFVKRAGKFMKGLLSNLNADTFTAVSAISDPAVSTEQLENIERTVKVLSDMAYVESQTDENGEISLRLTPSGVAHTAAFFLEE